MEKGALASAAGYFLLFTSACSLYVAWRHPILVYDRAISVDVPVVGKQEVHFKGARSLFVSYDGVDAVVPGLLASGSRVSAALLVAFGGVLPVAKILLTLRSGAWSARWARLLARWTLVDAFAEMLCVALLLQAGVPAQLQLGFAAFVVYVLASHGALALVRSDEDPSLPVDRAPRWMVLALATAFFGFFFVGLRVLAVRLWLSDASVMSQVTEEVRSNPAAAMLPLIGQTVEGIAKKIVPQLPQIRGEVSLISAASWLVTSASPCTMLGSLALLVLVLLLPVVDVLLSVGLSTGAAGPAASPFVERVRTHVHDLASLDVLVVGTCICCLVTRNVQQLSASPAPGLALLGCAAACQLAAYRVAAPPLGKKAADLV